MRLSFCLSLLIFCGPLAAVTGEDPTARGGSPGQEQVPPAQSTPTTQALPAQATSATQPSPATPTVPTNAPTATTTPPSAASPAHADKPKELTAEEKLLLSSGYHREVHKDQTTYCRREATLGSRFEKKICGTAEQLIEEMRLSREEVDRTMRQGIGLQPNPVQEGH